MVADNADKGFEKERPFEEEIYREERVGLTRSTKAALNILHSMDAGTKPRENQRS